MLTPDASVAEARAALVAGGHHAALVEQDGRPIGVVTFDALSHGADPGTRLGDVMDWECVHIAPDAGPHATVRAFTQAAWTSLFRRRPGRPSLPTKEEPDASSRLSRSRSEGLGRSTKA